MAWFTRFTRFGDVHMVYGQEAPNSCGIACVMMAVFKINKLVPGHAALHAEKHVYKTYSHVSKTHYDGSGYSNAHMLAATLNHLNVGKWRAKHVGMHHVPKEIISSVGSEIVGLSPLINGFRRGSPIIILVGWNANGAHFVLVDVVNNFFGSLYASVCDPWDGDVHITKFHEGHDFKYVGGKVTGSWDLGGKKHEYKTPSKGDANGWIIHQI